MSLARRGGLRLRRYRKLALALLLTLIAVSTATAKPPVFVLLLDTVRRDALATFNPATPVGERINRLARDGVVFDAARSNSSWTRTAVATLLTGLPAQVHKVFGRGDVLAPDFVTAAELFKAEGYRTAAWSANPNVLPVWGFARGFDEFVDVGASSWPKQKTDAGKLVASVKQFLDRDQQGDWFYYIHFMDAHAPYTPSPEDLEHVRGDARLAPLFPGPTGDGEVRASFQRYLAEIFGMDRDIGVLLDDLRRLGIYDKAVILVLADHGEEFLDHGGTDHGKTLYEEMLRVPVILKLPGNAAAGTRVKTPVAMTDLLPTLLRAAGASVPPSLAGAALWNGEKLVTPRETVQLATLRLDQYSKRAAFGGNWKLIVDHESSEELYDLKRDPLERHPEQEPQRSKELRADITAADARVESGWHLRACGSGNGRAGEFRFQLTSSTVPRGFDLEQNDHIQAMPDGQGLHRTNVDLSLIKRGRADGKSNSFIRDEDEVLVPAGETASPPLLITGRLRYAAGRDSRLQLGSSLRLDANDAAYRSHDSLSCFGDGVPSGESFVRIWFVPPAERLSGPAVDAGVKERMRQLGYGD